MPELVCVTKEGYRVYLLNLEINGRQFDEVHIDPHYEKKHPYMSDEKVLEIVKVLNGKRFVCQDKKGSWEYFELEPIFYQNRNYRLVWCLRDSSSFVGIRNCFYRKKYDKIK